jgi:hypothetical protein
MKRAKITQALLAKLNKVRGLRYPAVGYQYWADIKGDGQERYVIWMIINADGGVSRSVLNCRSARARCAAIRAEIKELQEELAFEKESKRQITETMEACRAEHAVTQSREILYRDVLKHAGDLLATLAGSRQPSERDLDDAETTADQIRHILK